MAKKSAASVLTRAMAKIEKGWTKGVLAADKAGQDVDPRSRRAVRWCALGAVDAADRNFETEALHFLRTATGRRDRLIAPWNNSAKSKSVIIAGFKRAIKLAKAAQRTSA